MGSYPARRCYLHHPEAGGERSRRRYLARRGSRIASSAMKFPAGVKKSACGERDRQPRPGKCACSWWNHSAPPGVDVPAAGWPSTGGLRRRDARAERDGPATCATYTSLRGVALDSVVARNCVRRSRSQPGGREGDRQACDGGQRPPGTVRDGGVQGPNVAPAFRAAVRRSDPRRTPSAPRRPRWCGDVRELRHAPVAC